MCSFFKIVFVFLAFFRVLSQQFDFKSNSHALKRSRRSDGCHEGNVELCVMKNFRRVLMNCLNGVEYLGLPSFQPLKLKHFKIDRSDSEINMDEVSLTGFQTCQLRSVHYTNNSKIFQTSIMIKHLVIEGSGYISGKLSILELGNQGHMRMNIDHLHMDISCFLHVVNETNRQYLQVKDVTLLYMPENFDLKISSVLPLEMLDNLLNTYINANWKIYNHEVNDYVREFLYKNIKEIANEVLKNVDENLINYM